MQIDMDALWLNLHQQYSAPGAFLGYQPFSFVFDDFLPGGVPLLFNQIVKSQPGTTSAAAELKSRLSEDELQLAEKLSSIGEQELADDLEVRMQAVRLLNGWIAKSDLAGTKAFRAVKSESVAIRRLRERQAEGQLPALAGPTQAEPVIGQAGFQGCLAATATTTAESTALEADRNSSTDSECPGGLYDLAEGSLHRRISVGQSLGLLPDLVLRGGRSLSAREEVRQYLLAVQHVAFPGRSRDGLLLCV